VEWADSPYSTRPGLTCCQARSGVERRFRPHERQGPDAVQTRFDTHVGRHDRGQGTIVPLDYGPEGHPPLGLGRRL